MSETVIGLPFQVKRTKEQAQEHDICFRSQVKAALAEAENPETAFVLHDTVQKQWAAKRQALAKLAGKSAP